MKYWQHLLLVGGSAAAAALVLTAGLGYAIDKATGGRFPAAAPPAVALASFLAAPGALIWQRNRIQSRLHQAGAIAPLSQQVAIPSLDAAPPPPPPFPVLDRNDVEEAVRGVLKEGPIDARIVPESQIGFRELIREDLQLVGETLQSDMERHSLNISAQLEELKRLHSVGGSPDPSLLDDLEEEDQAYDSYPSGYPGGISLADEDLWRTR